MPNRYLRESYIESERVNALGWAAETFWTRLLVKVDDFGRTEANHKLLRAKLFPLKLDQVREADVQRHLAECEKAGLIRLYTCDGKSFLQMERWERGRASVSKYPEPPTDSGVCKSPTTDSPDPDSDTDTDSDMRQRRGKEFEQFWRAYPRRKNKGDAEKAWKKATVPLETVLAAIQSQRASFDWQKDGGKWIPYPASWLNARGWEDEVQPELNASTRITTTAAPREDRLADPMEVLVAKAMADAEAGNP